MCYLFHTSDEQELLKRVIFADWHAEKLFSVETCQWTCFVVHVLKLTKILADIIVKEPELKIEYMVGHLPQPCRF